MSAFTTPRINQVIPDPYRRNFWHLYADIAWFGVLNGSSLAFVAVYATRMGATSWQMGLLSAIPGIITLFMALPAGQWLSHRPVGPAVFWSSIGFRLFYVSWVFLPWFLAPVMQVEALILITILMSFPGTLLAIGFNGLYAAAVPPEWRGHVAGWRNAAFAISSILTSLICGQVLEMLPFPLGFQVVFAFGALGALLSSLHLYLVQPLDDPLNQRTEIRARTEDLAQPGQTRTWVSTMRYAIAPRAWMRIKPREWLSLHVLKGQFGVTTLLLFLFHTAQFIVIPLAPLYTVNELGLSDQLISWGSALYYFAMLLASTQIPMLSQRLNQKQLLALGIVVMAQYPLWLGLATDVTLYMVASAVGGISFALVNGVLGNYLLERIPVDQRPPYLAWYNIGLNGAILLGSLLGPFLAGFTGLSVALLIGFVLRLLSGLALWKWG
jgi:hypothetical protein